MQFTGILIEWEEMFPYTGQLSKATNGYVYKMEDVIFCPIFKTLLKSIKL
jgi:hypothetical protein